MAISHQPDMPANSPEPRKLRPDAERLDVSIIMPCLNEAESVGASVAKALRWLNEHAVPGEVIVVDNGSSDDSAAVAELVAEFECFVHQAAPMASVVAALPHTRAIARSILVSKRVIS